MLTITCHNCDETLTAASEDELVELGLEHAEGHGHAPKRTHVLARVHHQNPDSA